MRLINREINLDLNCSENCFIVAQAPQATTFLITDTKLYIPVVTLSTQDNDKQLQQLKFGSKTTVNWNKYQSKVSPEKLNEYLDFLINPSFQGGNRLFILPFENEDNEQVTNDIIFRLEQ